jgi:hypothetical protein
LFSFFRGCHLTMREPRDTLAIKPPDETDSQLAQILAREA